MIPMNSPTRALSNDKFSERLYPVLQHICPAVLNQASYEFCYCLENVSPPEGWDSVILEPIEGISAKLVNRGWYESVKASPKVNGEPVMDETVLRLTQMLCAGLAGGAYPPEWVRRNFYFDLRGFFFLPRTDYFTPGVVHHLGGQPFRQFEAKQKAFESEQAVGYQDFMQANQEVDTAFFVAVDRWVDWHGTPILIGIAGPTAAGKTEITARLRHRFQAAGKNVTSLEMDHFFLDRDYREEHGIDSLGKAALHFNLFLQGLADLTACRTISTPRYDFINGTSSHDLDGRIKPGARTLRVEPADIVFMEGNFPFLLPEVAEQVALKVVYLTDDDVRLKRKWRRDMDFRKKYELNYFRNRYFREQFLMAQSAFIPQLEMCDLAVDTSGACLWVTPEGSSRLT